MSNPSATLPYAPSQATVAATPIAQQRARIAVIDVLRGLVMAVMLFDHTRETIYLHMQVTDPMTVETTDPALFFTRFAAHFCAPVFVFLTGLSGWLYAHPASGPRSATAFLIKRGLVLVALEFTVVSFAWAGKYPPDTVFLQVIWVIGLSMIVLGLIHKWPRWILAAVGVAIVFGHNALAGLSFEPGTFAYYMWTVLLHRGWLIPEGYIKLKVTYPLLPWIGVILLGYVAGPIYARTVDVLRRRKVLVGLGLGCLALLAVLRGFNIYGETLPWTHQETAVRTMMSFLNYTKYPPSLDFLLLTLGVGFLLLAWFESFENWLTRVFATFGGAPMFYYLLHLLVLLAFQHILVAIFGANHGERFGVDHVWPVWVIGLAFIPVLYFPVRAFAKFKRTSDQAWVRYF